MPAPDAVHPDAGGQGILRIGDGQGQLKPSAAVLEGLPRLHRQHFEKLPGRLGAAVRRIAAQKHAGVRRCRLVRHGHRTQRGTGLGPLQRLDLALEPRRLVVDLALDQRGRRVVSEIRWRALGDQPAAHRGPVGRGNVHGGGDRLGRRLAFLGLLAGGGGLRSFGGKRVIEGGDVLERRDRLRRADEGRDDRTGRGFRRARRPAGDQILGRRSELLFRQGGKREPGREHPIVAAFGRGEESLPALQDLDVQLSRAGEQVEFFDLRPRGEVVDTEQVIAGLGPQTGQKGVDFAPGALPHLHLGRGGLPQELLVRRRIHQRAEQRLLGGLIRRGEHAVQSVVILHRDRIEFVVVAAGARDGEAHQAAAHDVDPVVDDVVLVAEETPAEGEKTERGERGLVLAERQAVRGELFDDETVVRLVGVKGPDDVVAVGVRVRVAPLDVAREVTLRVGEARDIEPEAPPAFPIARRREEPLDHLGVGTGTAVADKSVGFLRRRRQAGEVVGHASQQCARIRGRRRCQALGLEPGEHERVDGRLHPRRPLHRRQGRFHHGLQRPVLPRGGHVERVRFPAAARIGRPEADPFFQHGDLFRGQFSALFLRRHLQILGAVAHCLDEETFVGITGDNRGPGGAALQQRVTGIEAKVALGFALFETVTLVAGFDQDRPDLRLEELELVGREGGRGGVGRGPKDPSDQGGAREGAKAIRRFRISTLPAGLRALRGFACHFLRWPPVHAINSRTTLPCTSVRR